MKLIEFLNQNNGAIMVIITAIYVTATIIICIFNGKSASESKKQVEEMKKQYEEANRPYIEVEFLFERRTWYIVRFVNNGKRTAQHVSIQLSQKSIDSLPEENVRHLLEKQSSKECIIGVGQHFDLPIGSNELRGNPNMAPLVGCVSYQANGKTYSNEIFIDLENYMSFTSYKTEHDDLMKSIKDEIEVLKSICKSIEKLNSDRKEEANV